MGIQQQVTAVAPHLKCHYDQNLDIRFFKISYTIGLS